jgi:hypothetical protein
LVFNHADSTYDLSYRGQIVGGTLVGGRTVNAFRANNGAYLNAGGEHAQVVIPNKFIKSTTAYTSITFSYWIHITDYTGSPYNTTMFIWGGEENYSDSTILMAGLANTNTSSRQGKLYMAGSAGGNALSSTNIFAVNTWYHVAIVVTSGSANMYLNGSSTPSLTQTGTIVINQDRSFNPICLCANGKFIWSDPTIKAYIANFRVYGRALNSSEISNLYTIGIVN